MANALGDDARDGDRARARLAEDTDLHALHLIDLEVLSVFRRAALRGTVEIERLEQAIDDLSLLPIVRYPHQAFARRCWELRENATPYDACYLALAETLGCAFVTADRRLRALPGVSCPVEVLV